MATVRRVLLASLLVVSGACGGRLLATDDGATTSGVTPLPPCATGASPTEPACGKELTSCDPMEPQGLPIGACSTGATCDVTVRTACACSDEPGPRFPWRCACPAGTWECTLMPPDGRICSNACLDAGVGPVDATPTESGGDGGAGTCPKPKSVAPPGPRLTSRAAVGSGVCAGRTLGQAIDAAYAAMPSLKDITLLYDPDKVMFDGSFVHAFAKPDGGFAIAFKRGGGDCPAGCTENEYWYFETDGVCTTKQVGHYLPTYGSGCVNVVGAPLWGTPPPLDPAYLCGADTTAQDISGTYAVCATGQSTACSVKGGDEPTKTFTTHYTVKIAQTKTDLSKGTVTITGTGQPKIDGIAFDATFTRRRFSVTKTYSNLPAKCPDEWQLAVSLDFEGVVAPGKLQFFEMHAVDCSETSGGGSYCKGVISTELFAP